MQLIIAKSCLVRKKCSWLIELKKKYVIELDKVQNYQACGKIKIHCYVLHRSEFMLSGD